MNKRTISTIGIIAAILMIVSGTELALARGGGGGKSGGSCNGKGPGYNSGAGMSQAGGTYQHRHRQQNQYQYRNNNGSAAQSGKRQILTEQTQLRARKQLRDPGTHVIEPAE